MKRSSSSRMPWLRILAEGVMIVTSILLAFAIEAWWDGRQERAKEKSYLSMLAADLRQTIADNETYSARADSFDWAGARLLRAYYEPQRPSNDSIGRWVTLSLSWWVVQPSLGTAQTLVNTGDLGLIRSDSIRAAVTEYLSAMTTFDSFEQRSADTWQETADELRRSLGTGLSQLLLSRTSAPVRDSLSAADDLYPFPAGPMRQLPPANLEALVRDEEVHQLLWTMNSAKVSMRNWRNLMRQRSERLLEVVEATLPE